MIKKILLVIVLVFLITGTGFAFQNEPDGFRGLKWGDAPTEDMEFCRIDRGMDIYWRPKEKKGIGNAEISIDYVFYKNQFLMVNGYFKWSKNYNILSDIFEEKYGNPMDGNINEPFYNPEWWGKESYIKLNYNQFNYRGYLIIANWKIYEMAIKDNKQKEAEKAKEDF